MTERSATTEVGTSTPIAGAEAASLATEEYARMASLLESLQPSDWHRPTPCTGWDVRALVAHVVGAVEGYASVPEMLRQQARGAWRARRTGVPPVDGWTQGHVQDLGDHPHAELVARFTAAAPKAVRRRMRFPVLLCRIGIDDGLGNAFTMGDLMRIVATRDCWLHRDDLRRATGRSAALDGHDARIVADVVAEWARRHGRPFTLVLTGPAGGRFTAGEGGPALELDALQFCRVLSRRAEGTGLLAQGVPF